MIMGPKGLMVVVNTSLIFLVVCRESNICKDLFFFARGGRGGRGARARVQYQGPDFLAPALPKSVTETAQIR